MIHPDLQRWLKQSTRGLDAELSAIIRDEIIAHYEDACADYQAQGYDFDSAHQIAMRDLGDGAEVGNAFRHVEYSSWRYLVYALVGLLYPLGYILSIPFNERLVGGIVFNLAIFLPMIYIVSSFRTLLRDRLSQVNIEQNVLLIRWGIILLCMTRFIGWEIYNHPTILESYSRSIFDAISLWEMGLNMLSIAGLLLTATGFVFIGEQTLHLNEDFYGILKLLGMAVMICGAGFGIYGISSLFGQATICIFAEMIAVMAGIIATLSWSYIFWRERHIQMIVA